MPKIHTPHLSRHSLHQQAFTLIELLIVMAVFGAISMIVLVAIDPQKRIHQAQNANTIAAAKQINSAIEQFFTLDSHYPDISCGNSWCSLPVTDPAFSNQMISAGILKEIPPYPTPDFANCEVTYFEKNARAYQLSFCLNDFDPRQSLSFTSCTLQSPGLFLCQNPPEDTHLCWYYEGANLSRCFVASNPPDFLLDFFPYP